MSDRQQHQQEVRRFLQKRFSIQDWSFSIPRGVGMESYFARGNEQTYFVKIGIQPERYLAMAEIGLTPPILIYGQLETGLPIIVQPHIIGRTPSRADYRDRLVEVAEVIRTMHHELRLQRTLPAAPTILHKDAGIRALNRLCQKWERYRGQVPKVAEFVDSSLEHLAQQVSLFPGEGLVASHGDICNANWLFASNGKIHLLDFESMSMDDPALDLGALLWWYYPPKSWRQFLEAAGYRYNDEIKFRMQIRMSLHCLDITLPREGSFDRFDPDTYDEALTDFRAILQGEENPEGHEE